MKLKYKILSRLLIITLIPIIITTIVVYYYAESYITKTTLHNLDNISSLQKKRVNELINQNEERLSALGNSHILPSIGLISNNNTKAKLDLDLILRGVLSEQKQYEQISIIDLHGKVIYSTDGKSVNRLYSNHNVYTIGKSGKYFDIDLDQDRKPVLFLKTPLMQNRTILGMLVAKISPDKLFNILNDHTGLGKTGEIFLGKGDTNHNVLVISPLRDNPNAAFKIWIPYAKINVPIVRAVYGQQSSLENVVDYNDKNVLAVTSYFPSTQWGLVVKMDSDEAFASITNVRNVILTSGVTMILSSVIASLFISKMISEPINKLRLACRRIAGGHVSASLEIVSNEPEYKDLTADINYMMDELKKTERIKNEFISMVSHELKTPLEPIIGYCEMLLDPNMLGGLKPGQSEAVGVIYDNIIRLRKIIHDLLIVQGLELGNLTFDQHQIHLKKFMSDIVSTNIMLMKKKNIEFVNTIKDDITITSDSNRLVQVFSNLIQNAVDFVQQNGKIEIGAQIENNAVIFHVKDNGVGIAKDKQKDLFKKFYQVDTSLQRLHGGTGLGLTICKGLVEGMGGKIWIESEEGKGTAFYFSIPTST